MLTRDVCIARRVGERNRLPQVFDRQPWSAGEHQIRADSIPEPRPRGRVVGRARTLVCALDQLLTVVYDTRAEPGREHHVEGFGFDLEC